MTPNSNEGVGVQIDYLECAYRTRYYIVNRVNGQINAIHDDSLELTEFKGHFSPFDLDNLEFKVCRLAVRDRYEENLFEHQDTFQGCDSDSHSQNLEESTGTGVDENNFSPILPVDKTASQQRTTRLTLMPKLMMEADLNISDPIHNRGKAKRINSFTATTEQVETVKRQSKGGPIKSSDARCQTQPSTSTQEDTGRPQVWCTACVGTDHLRKDCSEDVFCK